MLRARRTGARVSAAKPILRVAPADLVAGQQIPGRKGGQELSVLCDVVRGAAVNFGEIEFQWRLAGARGWPNVTRVAEAIFTAVMACWKYIPRS